MMNLFWQLLKSLEVRGDGSLTLSEDESGNLTALYWPEHEEVELMANEKNLWLAFNCERNGTQVSYAITATKSHERTIFMDSNGRAFDAEGFMREIKNRFGDSSVGVVAKTIADQAMARA